MCRKCGRVRLLQPCRFETVCLLREQTLFLACTPLMHDFFLFVRCQHQLWQTCRSIHPCALEALLRRRIQTCAPKFLILRCKHGRFTNSPTCLGMGLLFCRLECTGNMSYCAKLAYY